MMQLVEGNPECERKIERIYKLSVSVREKELAVALQMERIQQLRTAIELALTLEAKVVGENFIDGFQRMIQGMEKEKLQELSNHSNGKMEVWDIEASRRLTITS